MGQLSRTHTKEKGEKCKAGHADTVRIHSEERKKEWYVKRA